MTNKTKWIIGTAVVLVVLLLLVIFSNWFSNVLIDVAIYLIVFGAGWLLGRFAGKGSGSGK